MTENFARGIASVNCMASVAGADVIPVDIGVMGEIKEPGVRNCRIANGTNNMRKEPVMSGSRRWRHFIRESALHRN